MNTLRSGACGIIIVVTPGIVQELTNILYEKFNKFEMINDLILLYRHECFTGKYTTRKIYKNYIRDPSGLFSIISHVSLSIT